MGLRSKYTIYAYTLQVTLATQSPPIEALVYKKAKATGQIIVVHEKDRKVFAVIRSTEGPCAFIRGTTTGLGKSVVKRVHLILISAILLSGLLAILGTFLFVIRPLQARINIVSKSAENVGSDLFVAEPANSDPLGRISSVLAESHTRILKAQSDLKENHALEHHLAGVAHG